MTDRVSPRKSRLGLEQMPSAAAVVVAAVLWMFVVPFVAGGLQAEAGFSAADAWLASAVLPVLGTITAHRHHTQGVRGRLSMAWVVATGGCSTLLLHLAFHSSQGREFVYGWARAFGEAGSLLVLGTAFPHAAAALVAEVRSGQRG